MVHWTLSTRQIHTDLHLHKLLCLLVWKQVENICQLDDVSTWFQQKLTFLRGLTFLKQWRIIKTQHLSDYWGLHVADTQWPKVYGHCCPHAFLFWSVPEIKGTLNALTYNILGVSKPWGTDQNWVMENLLQGHEETIWFVKRAEFYILLTLGSNYLLNVLFDVSELPVLPTTTGHEVCSSLKHHPS